MELEEKPSDPFEQVYRIIKCPLKCILKRYDTLHPIIEKAVGEPNKIKRPWLSIIKQLTKTKYNIESKDFQFTENGKHIRTHSYNFTKICVPSL